MNNENELAHRVKSLQGSSNKAARMIIHQVISSLKNGEQDFKDGALLLGRGGTLPQKAYFHILYDPSDLVSIEMLEHRVGMPLPTPYRDFLQVMNGLRCFLGDFGIPHLALHGTWPDGYDPSEDKYVPFELARENFYSRLKDLPRDHWVIGSYQWDGSIICIDPSGQIYRRQNVSPLHLNSWNTFDGFVESEFSRFVECFNPDFSLKDPEKPTTP